MSNTVDRILSVTIRTFGINLLLILGLHTLPPLSFCFPLFLGFATGWTLRATPADGAVVGLAMAGYMTVVCAVVGGIALAVIRQPGLPSVVAVVGSLLVLHIGLFSGAGAVVGGHYARRRPPEPT